MFGRHAQADAQFQVRRVVGGAPDLGQLVHRLQREGPHAAHMIGFPHGFLALDRVPEAALPLTPQRLRDNAHFPAGPPLALPASAPAPTPPHYGPTQSTPSTLRS